MVPNYIFTSERLGFRNWLKKDKSPFSEMNADPEVMKQFPVTLSRAESDSLWEVLNTHFHKNGFTYFAVEELHSGEFIGFIGLKKQDFEYKYTPFIDLGWRIARKFWGKGYATEGAKACVAYAKSQKISSKLYCTATHSNMGSINIMRKIKMDQIDTFIHPKMDQNSKLQPCVCFQMNL